MISPWMGILLFGPVPLAYGIVLGSLVGKLEARMKAREINQLGIGWLALYGVVLTITLIGGLSLADPQLVFPSLFVGAYKAIGLSFDTSRSLHALLIVAFILAYSGMSSALLWSGARQWMAKYAAIALLAFSAAFFNDGDIFQPGMDALFIIRWLPGLLRTAGLTCLLLLIFWFPDGQFTPAWTRLVAFGLGGLSMVLFVGSAGNDAIQNLELALGVVSLAVGTLAIRRRYLSTGEPDRRAKILPFARVVVILLIYLVLLVAGIYFLPGLQAWNSEGLDSLFAFGPYLLPWLLLPAVLLFSKRRLGLWRGE